MHSTEFHNTLRDFFPQQILPPEYGGQGPRIEEACQDWTHRLLQSEDLLKQIAEHPTGDVSTVLGDSLISEEVESKEPSEG